MHHNRSPYESVLGRLERVRRSGPANASARCPAHEDRWPSLSIREAGDGRVLLRCHAGCDNADVVRALGVEWKDLFPPNRTIVTRKHPAPARRASFPRSVAEVLVETGEFAMTWEMAKALAELDVRVLRRDLASAWAFVSDRVDIDSLLRMTYLIRGTAVLRFCTSRSVDDPDAVRRAVRRFVYEVEEVVERDIAA